MIFTVGMLEDKIRKFPKGTIIRVECNCCKHGSSGLDTIKIIDNTGQTFGYISLRLNDIVEPKVELSSNEEKFYKDEIEKLNNEIAFKDYQINRYKASLRGISEDCACMLDEIENKN